MSSSVPMMHEFGFQKIPGFFGRFESAVCDMTFIIAADSGNFRRNAWRQQLHIR